MPEISLATVPRGEPVDVPMEWILHNVRNSVDVCKNYLGYHPGGEQFWPTWIGQKIDDRLAVVLALIMEHGFRVPVAVKIEPRGRSGRLRAVMGNGHHRVVAAILLCLDTIPVVFSEETWYPMESSGSEMTDISCDYDLDFVQHLYRLLFQEVNIGTVE